MAAASAAVAVAGATVTTRTLASYLSAGSRLASALRSDGAAALADGSVLHVVMGNEACDADSIVSAITYGYLKDSTATAAAATGATATSASSLHHFVSVMPIPRVEFKLRRETVYLLERCSVDTSDLVFADELDLAALHEALPSPDRLQLVLTDHNQVASKYAFLNEAVTEIVDHHQDAGAHPWVTGDARHIAFNTAERKGVGSACTLVAQKFESVAPDLLTPDVAAALLGVVLIDTSNLSEKAKKATPADHEAVALLDGKTPGVDKDELFTALQGEKFNPDFWASLSVGECLAYDYKVFTSAAAEAGAASTAAAALETGGPGADAAASGLGSDVTYGTSSVLVPLRDLCGKDPDAFYESMAQFAKARGLRLVLMLSFVVDPDLRRELVMFAPPGEDALFGAVVSQLREVEVLDLRPLPLSGSEDGDGAPTVVPTTLGACSVAAFVQGNAAASRKQLVPAMMDVLAKL